MHRMGLGRIARRSESTSKDRLQEGETPKDKTARDKGCGCRGYRQEHRLCERRNGKPVHQMRECYHERWVKEINGESAGGKKPEHRSLGVEPAPKSGDQAKAHADANHRFPEAFPGAYGVEAAVVAIRVALKCAAECDQKSQANCADGAFPVAAPIVVNGTFYGTTLQGGAHDMGTVYSLNPATGAETILHSFCGRHNCPDGGSPAAGLVEVNGTLHGTTMFGGAYGTTYDGGTVFSFDDWRN